MELKGKQLSLASKIAGGVYVIGASCAKFALDADWPIQDIVYGGVFLALLFAPVDVSKWIDKFKVNGNHSQGE